MSESSRKHILLVEDDATLAMDEEAQLQERGYAVRTVPTGEKAVEAVQAFPDIDLILMDIVLGNGMDGTQAAEVILKNHDIPIVFLSSHTEPEIVEKTERISSYGYVVKSSSISVLDASIKMAFRLFYANREKNETIRLLEEAKRRAQESEARFRVAQEMSPDGFTILQPLRNDDGEIIDFILRYENHAIARINGTDPAEVVGQQLLHLFPNHRDTQLFQTYVDVANTGQSQLLDDVFVAGILSKPTWLRLVVLSMETDIAVLAQDITERVLMQKHLSEKSAFFNDVLDNMLDLVAITNMDGVFLYAGRSHERLGYSVSALLGRSVMDFVHPDDLNHVAQEFLAFLQDKNDRTVEYRYRCSDGSYVWLETTGSLLKSEKEEPAKILFNTRDVTERKQMEEALTEKSKLLEESQELADLGSWQWDIENDMWHFSEQFKSIHGLSNDYGDTSSLLEIAHPEDAPYIEQALTESRDRGTRYEIEHRIIRAEDKEIRYLKAIGEAELDEETGRPIRVIGIAQDITKQKQTENEVRQLLNELQHRVKNNINTIASLLSLQAQTLEEPPAVAALEDAKNRVNSLNELYRYLYEAGSIGEGSLKKYLHRLIASEVEFFPVGKQVAIQTEIEECTCTTKTLSTLGLIANEVITNAMKYAFRDHPNPRLSVAGAHRDGHYVLTIEDNGPGIPDPDESHSSSGFGLMMVNGLAEQLGGTIQFENNGGTRVAIAFPVLTEK